MKEADVLILGAGIYGLYAALKLGEMGKRVTIVECDDAAFSRASFVNQARVHNGYHYPRSISTAKKSADYFQRFNEDFSFAINSKFKKVYALSSKFSYTNGDQFKKFCAYTGIPCREIDAGEFFKPGMIDAAFETEEYAFDAFKIRDYFIEQLKVMSKVEIAYSCRIVDREVEGKTFLLNLSDGTQIRTPFIINTTYASVNQVLELFGFEKFKIKYEICEIALCKPNRELSGFGLTVMDGPFFSIMPFGLDGTFSLTSVTFTPHVTSYEALPAFNCQKVNPQCSPNNLENCNTCFAKPPTAWGYMSQLARNYLRPEFDFAPTESLFAIKPILMASELDDSRPTVIREFSSEPRFVSCLSGKINTVYDLNEVIG